jgi:hypothetical protein
VGGDKWPSLPRRQRRPEPAGCNSIGAAYVGEDDMAQPFQLSPSSRRFPLGALDAVALPTSTSRDLLAFIHSGDVLRKALPWLLRIVAGWWLVSYTLLWFLNWPDVYGEFERWGLVQAFFAMLVSLATAFLVIRITILRAGHLAALPADDFVSLRAMAVLARWVGDTLLVWVWGSSLSSLLMPVGPLTHSLLSAISPRAAAAVSGGAAKALLVSVPVSLFWIAVVGAAFLVVYTLANAIDLALAIEFNTRAERAASKGA